MYNCHIKVIPLKLFYNQTFLKLGIVNIHDMNIKNAIKRWGHRTCLRVSRFLNPGIFYWLGVKRVESPKKIMFYYQTFFLLQICFLLDCS